LQRCPDILTALHDRGREITDSVLALTNGSKIGDTHAEPLAKVLESFVMYENHAAREGTTLFPARRKNFSDKQLDEISDQFEDYRAQKDEEGPVRGRRKENQRDCKERGDSRISRSPLRLRHRPEWITKG
jgi:hemerythrin-like domain-containing protein